MLTVACLYGLTVGFMMVLIGSVLIVMSALVLGVGWVLGG